MICSSVREAPLVGVLLRLDRAVPQCSLIISKKMENLEGLGSVFGGRTFLLGAVGIGLALRAVAALSWQLLYREGENKVCDTQEQETSEEVWNPRHNDAVGLSELGKSKETAEWTVLCSAFASGHGGRCAWMLDALCCRAGDLGTEKTTLKRSCLAFLSMQLNP